MSSPFEDNSLSGLRDQAATPLAAPPDDVPAFFAEILVELGKYEREMGGVRNFPGCRPSIQRKVKASDFRSAYTDYEYVYLTILGLARLHVHCEEIVRRDNGRVFTENPGVQLLEQRTGMTMHADRQGSTHLLRTAPASLVEAFAVAKRDDAELRRFFKDAFDRNADPCLEGRAGRIMDYLNSQSQVNGAARSPPWEDVALQQLPVDASPQDLVGEHLRVFVSECTWRWAQERGLDYAAAKEERQNCSDAAADFTRVFNDASFEAAMLARGVVGDVNKMQWEVEIDGGAWNAFGEEQNEHLERARLQKLPKCEVRIRNWTYEIDLIRMVQMNPKTKKERLVRCVESDPCSPSSVRKGQLTHEQLKENIAFFMRLDTIPEAPGKIPTRECGLPSGEALGPTQGCGLPSCQALAAPCAVEDEAGA